MSRSQVTQFLGAITQWVASSNIGKTVVKQQSIAKELFWPVFENNLSVQQIITLRETLAAKPFEIREGNIFEHLDAYVEANDLGEPHSLGALWKAIAEMTPTGLNTSPNACCGKYELLYRLVRPGASQPNKGDILDAGVVIELKGKEVRLSDPKLTGITYIKKTNEIFNDCEFEGNNTTTSKWRGTKVFEIEKAQHRDHYVKEFAKNGGLARTLISQYLRDHGFCSDRFESCRIAAEVIPEVADNGEGDGEASPSPGYGAFDQDRLQRVILKSFFQKYKEKQEFDRIIVFGDGTNVKFIENEDDLDKLTIYSDYFRIGQTANIGWYIR